MEAIETIGQILNGKPDVGRDAIHIAIMPVMCGDDHLRPGQGVKLSYGTTDQVLGEYYHSDLCIGVIDPFLEPARHSLNKGDKVWLFLKPGSISGLRHQWTHPVLDAPAVPISGSELWLRKFAEKYNFDWDEMIGVATRGSVRHSIDVVGHVHEFDSEYITAHGVDLHGESDLEPGELEDFWHHMQQFTGLEFVLEHRKKVGWSCTC
jgi:hypothetical protein